MGVGGSKDEACLVLPCLLLRPRHRPADGHSDARLGTPAAEDELFRSILRLQPACGEACTGAPCAPGAPAPTKCCESPRSCLWGRSPVLPHAPRGAARAARTAPARQPEG